jgi:subtilase family serine protease
MRKMKIVRTLAPAAIAALLCACHGGGGGSAMLPSSGTAGTPVQPYTGSTSLTFGWGQGALTGQDATYLGPATIPGNITLNVQPQLRNEQGLLEYARETADPHSGNYRRWLTPQEIGTMFGASDAAIKKAGKYFASYHLSAGTWPQHLMMVVSGTQANVEQAFGTKFGRWQVVTPAGIKTFYAPQPGSPPHFAMALPVVSVMNLVSLVTQHTYIERPADVQGYGYDATIIRNGFDYGGMINSGYQGQGINLGIIGTGPISSADVPEYAAMSGNAHVATVVQKNVTAQPADSQNNETGTATFDPYPGDLATPPPVTAPTCNLQLYTAAPTATCNPEDGEAQLDTEQQAGMAPDATVNFYLAFNSGDCTYYGCASGSIGVEGIYLTDDEIQQVIADDIVDTLSLSYGEGEPFAECDPSGCYYNSSGAGPGPDEFAALASEGVTTFVSSGDNGAYQCDSGGYPETTKCASYPALDPSVIAVGGVNAPFTTSGQLQPSTQITAWGENDTYGGDGYFDNSAGSGGGPSCCFAAPTWQSSLGASKRETPDISLLADPSTGPLLVTNWAFSGYQGYGASGGTSASAPEAAAMFADFLSACKANATCAHAHGSGTYGYRWGIAAAQAFYAIATAQANFGAQAGCSGASPGAFYNVCAGSNGVNSASPSPGIYTGFPATPGYNMVTGLGVPFGGYLVNKLFAYCSCGTPNLP